MQVLNKPVKHQFMLDIIAKKQQALGAVETLTVRLT